MAHILFQNRGSIGLHGIRLLGCSNKTAEKIGRFGTGLKEAIALFCRLKIGITIFSDERRIDFQIQEIDGQKEICFCLDTDWGNWKAGVWHGLGLHPGFGKYDWNDMWQAMREVVCNAYDEEGFHHQIVGDGEVLKGVPGSTRVYIEADHEVMKVYFLLPQKLLFMQKRSRVIHENEYGKILEKADTEKVDIFHKGVWVDTGKNVSIFDYEIKDLKLAESRTADYYEIRNMSACILGKANRDVLATMMHHFKDEKWDETFEAHVMVTWEMGSAARSNGKEWYAAWLGVFSDNACACTADSHVIERVRRAGYTPIILDSNTLSVLESTGMIRTHKKILTKDELEGMDIIEAEVESLHTNWMILQRCGVTCGVAKPKTYTFTKPTTEGSQLTGFLRDGGIHLNLEIIGSRMEEETMFELLCQHVSKKRPQTIDYEQWLAKTLRQAVTV